MDLRIQKTKQSLFDAFTELRSYKPIEKISVKELTDKAKISKQTFYLHYKDIYDLSEKIEQSLIETIMSDIYYPDNLLAYLDKITVDIFKRAIALGQPFKYVFSGSRVSSLTDGIEKNLKQVLYMQHPELRADLKTSIYLTVLVQGCYNAYQHYSTIDQDLVVEILGDITKSISDRYFK